MFARFYARYRSRARHTAMLMRPVDTFAAYLRPPIRRCFPIFPITPLLHHTTRYLSRHAALPPKTLIPPTPF